MAATGNESPTEISLERIAPLSDHLSMALRCPSRIRPRISVIELITFAALIWPSAVGAAQTKGQTYEPAIPAYDNSYPLTADSKPHPNVPTGKTFDFYLKESRIFPGTSRKIVVYVPAEYDAKKPACLYVSLDNLKFETPIVFDNLIAKHEMPVTIAISISSASVKSASGDENPRFDRSFEFDTRSDRLARFILEEIIPEVEQHKTPQGDPIIISTDPNDRAIGGASTGGIGAFTVAWERPDAFRRVFISIGTFVGMRGGEQYYVQVRKTEPKPLRIFEEDGANDEWPGGPEMGDWFMGNLTMTRALEFAGYDVKHSWGTAGHQGNHAAAVFPDAMRWLWRGYPSPVKILDIGNPRLKEILQPGEFWSLARLGCAPIVSLGTDPQGQVSFRSSGTQALAPIVPNAKPEACATTTQSGSGAAFAFGADGTLYLALPKGGIQISDPAIGVSKVVATGLSIRNFVVRSNGEIYATTQADKTWGELWLIDAKGGTTKLDDRIKGASGLALTPDGLWLFITQSLSHEGLSYRVLSDGKLDQREPFYDLYAPETEDDSGAGEIAMDANGLAYVATRLGIQIFDRNGRVIAILPLPKGEAATGVTFGGPGFDTLYVSTVGGRIYKRKLQTVGVPPFAAPIKLPKGRAG